MSNIFDDFRNRSTPPRPPEQRVGNPQPAPISLTKVRFDGIRNNRCYTGHVLNDDGTLGAACQFVIENDPGTYSLPANTIVTCEEAPKRLADLAIWTSTGTKYLAISTAPFSQLT